MCRVVKGLRGKSKRGGPRQSEARAIYVTVSL